MQIVIEGPDGSGKSTLIQEIQRLTGWWVIPGQGPEKYPGEVISRAHEVLKEERYAQAYRSGPRIYDRHPCVSHPIYCGPTGKVPLPISLANELYMLKGLMVYCAPTGRKPAKHHVLKEYDTEEHLNAIEQGHAQILKDYEEWALRRADLIYRYWVPGALQNTSRTIIAAVKERT